MPRPGDYLARLFQLKGKVAVVIGGTGELCGAMAEGLAAAGARVVLVGRNADKAKQRLQRMAAKSFFVQAEATRKTSLEELRDKVLRRLKRIDIVINGAGLTYTSVAILDGLLAFPGPIVEVHMSNIYRRESFRHHSFISKAATGSVAGLGADGYELALEAMRRLLDRPQPKAAK